ncbi:MAG: transglutaminase domain-containing protein [Theionarchaea archaeon]|nr:transglutaminase domain-containing protein [Theionarchaea archaeon]
MQPRLVKKSVILSAVIVLFIFSCGGSINPLMWKSQVERRISPQILIQPQEMNYYFQEVIDKNPYEIFEFIESEIEYTDDFLNHASLDHLPTAEEVIHSGKDDCDGQAVILCSILRFKGYPAYTVVGPSHAWVEVEGYDPINYKGGTWFVRFNESSAEWNITSLLLLILEEFALLTIVFSLVLYGYEKGVLMYVKEVLSYFKYVFLFFLGYILIGVFVLFAKSTLWVFWLVIFLMSLLLVMKVMGMIRKY